MMYTRMFENISVFRTIFCLSWTRRRIGEEYCVALTIKEHVSEFIKRNDPRSRFSNIIIGHKTRWAWSNKPVYRCSNCIFFLYIILLLLNTYSYSRRWVSRPKPDIAYDRCHTAGLHKYYIIDLAMTFPRAAVAVYTVWKLIKCPSARACFMYFIFWLHIITSSGRSPNASCSTVDFSLDILWYSFKSNHTCIVL